MNIIPKINAPDNGFSRKHYYDKELRGVDAEKLHRGIGVSGNNLFGVSSIYRAGYNNPNLKISRGKTEQKDPMTEHYKKLHDHYKNKYGV